MDNTSGSSSPINTLKVDDNQPNSQQGHFALRTKQKAQEHRANWERRQKKFEDKWGNHKLLYQAMKLSMKLSRLEEAAGLTLVLRYLVKNSHPRGKVCHLFVTRGGGQNTLEVCVNLPTDPAKLQKLVEQVFCTCSETLNLDQLYKDFVITQGRIVYDYKQNIMQLNGMRTAAMAHQIRIVEEELGLDEESQEEEKSKTGGEKKNLESGKHKERKKSGYLKASLSFGVFKVTVESRENDKVQFQLEMELMEGTPIGSMNGCHPSGWIKVEY
ncbi:hypothetical protein ILUMI_17623 [Ignelater luminosus]|uniref:Uncharacterized protein n=1 Tax=Ignelater luminosus TaxID=2038154 RepID=A0A8K0CRX7_IGNLU|nr:hypothetical protein ILUMI_17623 [Ignelater luminosus]